MGTIIMLLGLPGLKLSILYDIKDFLKEIFNNSFLACWFYHWKGLFSLAVRNLLVHFSTSDAGALFHQ